VGGELSLQYISTGGGQLQWNEAIDASRSSSSSSGPCLQTISYRHKQASLKRKRKVM
jgi:hypothetical protein